MLAGNVEAGDSTLESWLGVHERPPSSLQPPPSSSPPPSLPLSLPPPATVATHTTVIRKESEANTDWRLIPFVAAQASDGVAGQPILLSIAVTSPYGQSNPQHEAITYVLISNLPAKSTLSQGREVEDGTWQVPLEGLPGLTLTVPPDVAGPLALSVTAVTDHGGGVVARQSKDLTIPILQAAGDQPATGQSADTGPSDKARPAFEAASAEPPDADRTAPPAQGGSSQGVEAAAPPVETGPDTRTDDPPVMSGSSMPPSLPTGETTEARSDPSADAFVQPAPEPAAPSPADPTAAIQAAIQTALQKAVAAPLPEPPEPRTALAAVPAVTAPPPAPDRPSLREEAVQRPAKPPSVIPEAALMKRGDDLFAQGDLAGARLYYEMAAGGGSAKAAFALGRTHDPLVHERLHVRGLPPDPEQAAAWYRRAVAAGSGDAEQQLKKLTDWLAAKSR
ncbi:hypothetical protein [Azospirillum endophyticum]